MRALFVTYYPVFGGPHNEALRLHPELAERGWDLTAVVPSTGDAAARLAEGGVPVVGMDMHRLRATADIRQHLALAANYRHEVSLLQNAIRDLRADVAVTSGLTNFQAAVAAAREEVPLVWQIPDTRVHPLLRRPFLAGIRRYADAIMFTGERVRAANPFRNAGMPEVVYYPPVDTSLFQPSAEERAATRRRMGIPLDVPLVGTIANLNPLKGIEYFVSAAEKVHRSIADTWFLVVGSSYDTHQRYEARIRAQAAASGVPAGRFLFAGARSDPEVWYPALDVMLLTSVSEGSPTTIEEAMSCGVPVVATDVGSVPELVSDGVTGFVVPALDSRAIARAAVKILMDPDLASRFARAGRDLAAERFDVKVVTEHYVAAFNAARDHSLLRQHGQARPSTGRHFPLGLLRDLLVCPACRGSLGWCDNEVNCSECGASYPVVDGIPVLLTRPDAASHDELDHHRQGQQDFYDSTEDEEFEISRPRGTPRFHRWLLDQKFRRSVSGIEGVVQGGLALTVCGGSGMDAEFLARAGANVICSDLSLGAAKRGRERARRMGLPLAVVVADVESLPFRDQAIDLVYVHDGLHHLVEPVRGVREMARVARAAISITEPARAATTWLAVRLGVSQSVEEAGNAVARLKLDALERLLASVDYQAAHSGRYVMFYRHHPGRASRLLSIPGLFGTSRLFLTLANKAIGSWGNKLVLTARREA